ncbi:MAG: helix-turn-helix domain-containing protein [Dehalococcoidia bacterium]|jgi:excisionase family DNA binding protein
MNSEKLTISVEEAGAMLGISRALAYQMANTGKLPILRFGKRMLVPRKAFENMLANAPVDNKPQAS